ncbi:MAG: gliding motility protein GldM [Chlorobi bacterium]|nr:gliding motility protein GldM [Chlorobiota bacterium]
MGHGKETPRQKMIGMMYLVLTALLALNVSKSVLNAFLIVDNGLHSTNESFERKINYIYNEIDNQVLMKGDKVKPAQKAGKDAFKWTNEIYEYIEDLKKELIVHVDKKDEAAADTLAENIKYVEAKDNYDGPTHLLLSGGDVNKLENSKARELRKKLDEYRENLISLFDRDGIVLINEKKEIEKMGDLGIDTRDDPNPDQDNPDERHWEFKKFYHAPLWAVLTILTQIQSEVLNAESLVAEKLLSSIGAREFKFNKLDPTIIPKSNYVIKGNEYVAEVFLAAFDSTQAPEIYVGDYKKTGEGSYEMTGNYTTLPIEKGRGIYKVRGSRIGDKKWGGLISLTAPDGSKKSYPFSEEYTVAEANLVVSPTKMNVFYMAIPNPVDISVPGYAPNEISATISNGKISKDRSVGFVVKPQKPGKAIITVYAQTEGGRKPIGTKEFRVKPLPTPVAKVAGKTGGNIRRSTLKVQNGVIAELEDFLFDLSYRVTKFTVSTTIGGYTAEESAKGNKFTPKQKKLFQNAKRGSRIYIQDIVAIGPDKIPKELPTISFKLK